MPLNDIRKKIDALDTELLELLSQRADLVHKVGEIKKKEGLQIYAPEREHALLDALSKKNKGRLDAEKQLALSAVESPPAPDESESPSSNSEDFANLESFGEEK